MAAPIAHIFLALQMLAGPFEGYFNEREFILGTSFPDIRYLKVVERSETHFSGITLEAILQEKNSFKAGMLFHSFVDEQREAYVVENHFYEKIPTFRFTSQSLKFAEDELLRTLYNTKQYQSYFDEIIEEERTYSIPDDDIHAWHTFLKEYFDENISSHELLMKYFDLHNPDAWSVKRCIFSWFYALKIEQTIFAIKTNAQLKKLILDFYWHFSERNTL